MRDYYSVLGVSPDAEAEVIAAAYKALMRKYHPDTNKSPDAAAKAQALNAAYETLKDPARRRAYEQTRPQTTAKSQPSAKPKPSPGPQPRASRQGPRHGQTDGTRPKSGPKPSAKAKPNPKSKARPNPHAAKPKGQTKQDVSIIAIVGCGFALALGYGYAYNFDLGAVSDYDDVPASVGTPGNMMEAEGAYRAPIDAPSIVPEPLFTTSPMVEQPIPTLGQFTAEIDGAITDFIRVQKETGMIGAIGYSKDCEAAALQSNDILKTDYCVAFDMTASMLNDGMSKGYGVQRFEYFDQQLRKVDDQYARFPQAADVRPSLIWSHVQGGFLPALKESIENRK